MQCLLSDPITALERDVEHDRAYGCSLRCLCDDDGLQRDATGQALLDAQELATKFDGTIGAVLRTLQ